MLMFFRRPGILVLVNDVDWELRYVYISHCCSVVNFYAAALSIFSPVDALVAQQATVQTSDCLNDVAAVSWRQSLRMVMLLSSFPLYTVDDTACLMWLCQALSLLQAMA